MWRLTAENPDGNFVITESNYQGNKDGPLLGLKYTIIDCGVLWGTVGSPEWKREYIRVGNPGGNSKIIPVGTSDGEPLGLIDNKMLGIADSYKLENELGFGISE